MHLNLNKFIEILVRIFTFSAISSYVVSELYKYNEMEV